MRFYYYAARHNDEQWALHSSLEPKPTLHPNEQVALLDAKKNCRRRWEETGSPCGVKVQNNDGEWEDYFLVGGEGLDVSGDAQSSLRSEPDVGEGTGSGVILDPPATDGF